MSMHQQYIDLVEVRHVVDTVLETLDNLSDRLDQLEEAAALNTFGGEVYPCRLKFDKNGRLIEIGLKGEAGITLLSIDPVTGDLRRSGPND